MALDFPLCYINQDTKHCCQTINTCLANVDHNASKRALLHSSSSPRARGRGRGRGHSRGVCRIQCRKLSSFHNAKSRLSKQRAASTDVQPIAVKEGFADEQDYLKGGGTELGYVQKQQTKDMDQPKIADKLDPLQNGDEQLDLIVIGCGPAGLSLAAESAKQGLTVALIGPDMPFTNNYGVWEDEFQDLGLQNCIEHTWKDTAVYLESDEPLLIGRAYGRVNRNLLRSELLQRCAKAGVLYLDSKAESITESREGHSYIHCENGFTIHCRLVTVASGAASGKFLQYELDSRQIVVQTAYGIEVEVQCSPFDPAISVFMDYRDYTKSNETDVYCDIPSFLYAMPLSTSRVFLEETCLASRPAVPFETLKRRLHTRLESMGIRISNVFEEEWSYIPVGTSLPSTKQKHLGFGAAASMVHPATGYSVVRSLSEAPSYAAAIANVLKRMPGDQTKMAYKKYSIDAASRAWETLWPQERKRRRVFFLFGLELILQLNIEGTRMFFGTFFKLPDWLWKGFLASRLSSAELVWFALVMFVMAPNTLRFKLIKHLMSDPSGEKLLQTYTRL